jgi:hypothetical protein
MKDAIFLSGKAESGKTSTANILKKEFEKMGYKVALISFADYLKFVAQKYFNWDGKKDSDGRTLLQKIGTDIVRSRQPDFWSMTVARFINVFQKDFDFFIADDTRFIEEVNCLKAFYLPSKVVRIKRINFENHLTPKQRLHFSETALDNYNFDYVVESESGLDNLKTEVEKFIDKYYIKKD